MRYRRPSDDGLHPAAVPGSAVRARVRAMADTGSAPDIHDPEDRAVLHRRVHERQVGPVRRVHRAVLTPAQRREPPGGAGGDLGRVQVLLEPPPGGPDERAAVGRPCQVMGGERHVRDAPRRAIHRHDPEPAEREHPHAPRVGRERETHERPHVLRRAGLGKPGRRQRAPRAREGELGGEGDLDRRATRGRHLPQPAVGAVDEPASVAGPPRPRGRHVGLAGEPHRRRPGRVHRHDPELGAVRGIRREEGEAPAIGRERRCERRESLGR